MSLCWLVKSNTITVLCTRFHSIQNREDNVSCYHRANMTADNCLTNICLSLSMLLNTLLSNRAPLPRHYFRLFADSMVGCNKTIMKTFSLHYGVLRSLCFQRKLRFCHALYIQTDKTGWMLTLMTMTFSQIHF